MILTTHTQKSFHEYVEIAREAGFELADVRSIPERGARTRTAVPAAITFLISFRKPFIRHSGPQTDAEPLELQGLLTAAAGGRRVLYAGLAQLLLDELAPEDLAAILPSGARGTELEQLMEVLASDDPRTLLEQSLGMSGLRRIAQSMGMMEGQSAPASPLEAILSHFGLTMPPRWPATGVEQVLRQIRQSRAQVQSANRPTEIRGAFLDASTAIERLLRNAVWGWAHLAFGSERDAALLGTLASPTRPTPSLDRLSFGDVVTIFENLANAIAQSPQADLIERKFGRRHVYLPSNRQTRFVERLRNVAAQRNRIEHDKDGYWSGSDTPRLASDCAAVLVDAEELVARMAADHAVPRTASAIGEWRDQWGRISYRLTLDDGTEVEVHLSTQLALGTPLLYFGSSTNPRPVDPLYVAVSELGPVP